MDQQFATLDYHLQFDYVRPLIDRNYELARQFKLLLTASNDDIRGIKTIADKLIDATFLSGMQTWKGALVGYDSTTNSGLLRGWNRAVFLSPTKVFNLSDASAIQQQWDYFDAHQAMTVNFIMKWLNLNDQLSVQGRQHQARALLDEWYNNRKAQLALLRGNSRLVDRLPVVRGDAIVNDDTRLMALPPRCVVDKTHPVMWFIEVSLPLPNRAQYYSFYGHYVYWRKYPRRNVVEDRLAILFRTITSWPSSLLIAEEVQQTLRTPSLG